MEICCSPFTVKMYEPEERCQCEAVYGLGGAGFAAPLLALGLQPSRCTCLGLIFFPVQCRSWARVGD